MSRALLNVVEPQRNRMHIAILHNCDHDVLADDPGREARKDVLRVAAAMAEALNQGALTAEPVGVGRDVLEVAASLQRRKPVLVVNLCESLGADSRGEMALPCLLDLLGIPYTGSGPLALGLSLHKNKAKEVLSARGVTTPESCVVESISDLESVALPYPLIVKPTREDASVGIDFGSVVSSPSELHRAALHVLRVFGQPAIVERYIDGREIYVSILGNRPRRALPLTEIRFGKAFENRPKIVSYRAKWDVRSAECIDSPSGPCLLDASTEGAVTRAALAAFEALECRDYGRVDVRLSSDGRPYVIDVNPNCDLHPHAGFAKAAASAGIDYASLASSLVEIALERSHGNKSRGPGRSRAARKTVGPHRDVLASRGAMRPRAHRARAQADQP